ncbi:MAG TPA: sugar ABC transporter permease [Candidatus Limnocylindrales bacterium]
MRFRRGEIVALCAPLGILLGGWLVLPAIFGLVTTLTTYGPSLRTFRFVGLANYSAVLRDPDFGAAVRNIVVFCATAVPVELVIGFGIAYAVRGTRRGRRWIRIALLLPWLLSPIGSGVMWHFLLAPATGPLNFILGWLNLPEVSSPSGSPTLALPTAIAIEVWRLSPLVAFLLVPALEAVPAERWEDARLDGLGVLGRITNVVLPAIRPVLASVTMLAIGLALGTFDSLLILTGGGPGTATVTPALFSYKEAYPIANWPISSAAAWIIALAVIGTGAAYLKLAGGAE